MMRGQETAPGRNREGRLGEISSETSATRDTNPNRSAMLGRPWNRNTRGELYAKVFHVNQQPDQVLGQ